MPIVCLSSAHHLLAVRIPSPLPSSAHSDNFCESLCKIVTPPIPYRELPVLEVISRDADAETLESARRLAEFGYVAKAA